MSSPVADSTKDVEKMEKKLTQRRINKPLIEKRRRARINDCLAQLKAIVLEASDNTQSPRPSKLEKADILEMTVDFIKKRVPTSQPKTEMVENDSDTPSTLVTDTGDEFTAGYCKCLQEISGFLEKTQTVNERIKQDVVSHISQKLKHKNQNQVQLESQTRSKEKTQIIPTKKRKIEVTSTQEPEVIDLSVNIEHTINQKQPLDLSKTAEVHSQNQTGNSVISNQNTHLPLGLLCGGQIMLLVQVPQSLTSQQYLTQSLTLQNGSLQSTLVNNNLESFPSLNLPPTNATCVPNNTESVTNKLNESDLNSTDNNTDPIPACPPLIAGNQKGPYIPGHWRPW